MTRVSENSSTHSANYSIAKSKQKLEDLQLKGASLKRMHSPSDDPVGNVEVLAIRSQNIDSDQFLRNANFAKTQLNFTDNALEELSEIMMKAKEIAIGQSSNLYSPEDRLSVSREVAQMRNQALSISNRRIGNKFIFSGHKTLTTPFNKDGKYFGDKGVTSIEVQKDFFIPANLSGYEVFFEKTDSKEIDNVPFSKGKNNPFAQPIQEEEKTDNYFNTKGPEGRELASIDSVEEANQVKTNIFDDLRTFESALVSNNREIIQTLLDKFDNSLNNLVGLRTKIGSVINSIENSESNIGKTKIYNEEYKSRIEDADVAELFTDINKQQGVLKATYQSSSNLVSKTLMDFLR
jgi:flagellar hook-associated protein 3 FlgL